MRKIIRYRILFLAISSTIAICTAAQTSLPVIHSSSRSVDIRDGQHYRKGYWYIFPQRNPDLYFTEMPQKNHRVSFITDKDSISFDIEYGREYDFIILLNNKDSCHTRIVADYRDKNRIRSNRTSGNTDTIPFSIGNNSKIYLQGRLNHSDLLDIQFDMGNSGVPLIKKSSIEKVNMAFDDSLILSNSDGMNKVPYSRSNLLSIAGLSWDSIPVTIADNMTYREDLIAGNWLFRGKIVEINYDKKIILIHDSLPSIDSGYTGHDILLDMGVVPFLQVDLLFGSTHKKGWFLFDTGAYTSILSREDIPASNKMLSEARGMIGLNRKSSMPELHIGNYHFTRFNYTTQNIRKDGMTIGLLGNDLLKRFNIILDNPNGRMYMKPNSLTNLPYVNPEYYAVRIGAGFFILFALLVVILARRRKKKRKQ